MIEHGMVVAVRSGSVDVVLQGSAACAGCNACHAADSGELLLRDVAGQPGIGLGDEVEVLIPESLRMRAALAVYVVPLGGLILGYVAGSLLGRRLGIDPDVTGALVGIVLATVAFAATRVAERTVLRTGRFTPRVRAIISRGSGRTGTASDVDDS
ncbi:MAG: SoxR reducing system RseC family protein [Actinomycetia bacterium]|nr:SoxR reducing system RseC family protein [Actinomycetes bacterium]